jgi:cytochrome P450
MTLPPGPRAPAAVNAVRFARRPLEVLRQWHARYGDVFTVTMTVFGTGVYVADPDAIRELFTGDQSDLRAGEANSFMEPVLGPHSVLILDGTEHLRQRKLLLPPFQGSRVAAFREVIRDVAEREIASWRPGTQIVLRVAVPAVELRALREQPDPVVLRGITLAPKHGVQVAVQQLSPATRPPVAAVVQSA